MSCAVLPRRIRVSRAITMLQIVMSFCFLLEVFASGEELQAQRDQKLAEIVKADVCHAKALPAL